MWAGGWRLKGLYKGRGRGRSLPVVWCPRPCIVPNILDLHCAAILRGPPHHGSHRRCCQCCIVLCGQRRNLLLLLLLLRRSNGDSAGGGGRRRARGRRGRSDNYGGGVVDGNRGRRRAGDGRGSDRLSVHGRHSRVYDGLGERPTGCLAQQSRNVRCNRKNARLLMVVVVVDMGRLFKLQYGIILTTSTWVE